MTFSKFARMLYPYIGKGMKTYDFVLFLVDLIMEQPVTEVDNARDDDDNYNPLDRKQKDTLGKYYNGTREFSKKDSGAILARLNMDGFIEYLSELPVDIIDLLHDDMLRNGVKVDGKHDIFTACTNLFVSILKDLSIKGHALTIKQSLEHPVQESNDRPHTEPPTNPYDGMTPKQMRDIFNKIVDSYKIMDIINRTPPILNRDDSIRFDTSARAIGDMIIDTHSKSCTDAILYENIRMFRDELRILALTLEGRLNLRYGLYDDSASINMEGGDTSDEAITYLKQCGVPELTPELILALSGIRVEDGDDYEDDDEVEDGDDYEEDDEVNDRVLLDLLEIYLSTWGGFSAKMNLLYKEICHFGRDIE